MHVEIVKRNDFWSPIEPFPYIFWQRTWRMVYNDLWWSYKAL